MRNTAVQVSVKVPLELLAALDAEVRRRREAHPGARVGRADVIRTLLHPAVASLRAASHPEAA